MRNTHYRYYWSPVTERAIQADVRSNTSIGFGGKHKPHNESSESLTANFWEEAANDCKCRVRRITRQAFRNYIIRNWRPFLHRLTK